MTPRLGARASAAKVALASISFVSVPARGGCHLVVSSGVRLPLALQFDDEWLTLTCPATQGAEPLAPWDGLRLNDTLGGFARLALTPGETGIDARADVALHDGVDLPRRLSLACEGLRAAARACRAHRGSRRTGDRVGADRDTMLAALFEETGRETPDRARISLAAPTSPQTGEPGTPADDGSLLDLPTLLTEAGWPYVQRARSRFAVDLGVRGQFLQALIEPTGGAGVRLRATLGVFNSPPATTRTALGVLLLTVSAAVRLVRGGAETGGAEPAVFVETWLDGGPTVEEVDQALSALAVAGQMVGRETRALSDERVARAYLSARGWTV